MRKKIILLYTIICFLPLAAETFRVSRLQTVTVNAENYQTLSTTAGYNDAVAIIFKNKHRFLRGIEIEITQPPAALNFPRAAAYGLYAQTAKKTQTFHTDISARPLFHDLLPEKKIVTLQIPVRKNHGLKKSPYVQFLSPAQDPETDALILRFSPAMKGLPDEFIRMKYTVKVKPLLTQEGALHLHVRYPDDTPQPISILLNEKDIITPEQLTILPTGHYHLTLNSDHYRSEIRNFTIEQARIFTLDIALKSQTPQLIIQAPAGTQILLDGTPFEPSTEPINISIGDHRLSFKIGTHELERTLAARAGKTYHVNLMLDVIISEEN